MDERKKRLSIKDIDVTPNHHAMARRWSVSDNFYADSDVSVDGHHWLVGSPPNAWTESSLMAAYSDQKKDFRLGMPPLNLYDAAATDLSDCFTLTPDPADYKVLPVDPRLFDPATARKSKSGVPGPRMDDPREVRR